MGFEVRATYQINAVRHRCKNAMDDALSCTVFQTFQRFGNRFGLAGLVDDQALTAYHCHLPGQDRSGHKFQTDLAHLLAKAWHFFVGNGPRGFGCDVANGGACSTCCEDQTATQVDQFNQRGADALFFVGDEARFKFNGVFQGLGEPCFQGWQAFVFIDASAGAVADGNNANFDGVVMR